MDLSPLYEQRPAVSWFRLSRLIGKYEGFSVSRACGSGARHSRSFAHSLGIAGKHTCPVFLSYGFRWMWIMLHPGCPAFFYVRDTLLGFGVFVVLHAERVWLDAVALRMQIDCIRNFSASAVRQDRELCIAGVRCCSCLSPRCVECPIPVTRSKELVAFFSGRKCCGKRSTENKEVEVGSATS